MHVSSFAKAIVAAVVAGVGALSVAVQDGALGTGDGVTIVLAVLGALGVTYVVPNSKDS
ncbi:hypothetical protein [Streptomyces microflavus]|uniref:hypothetical protein n=1 Tax=Streptomyces microflavus TaxID=1919 RepID=UPI0036B4715B